MKSKKFVLAGLVLLAITMVLLPLAGCKNDSVPETPEAKQEQAGGTEGNNDSTNTEDNTSGGGDSGTVPPEAHTHTFGDWQVEEASVTVKKVVEVCEECHYAQEVTDFVYIPTGQFKMGSTAGYDDEEPDHEVSISKGYFMGRHEVTQQLYLAVMKEWGGTEPSSTYGEGVDYPAYYVSWYDAVVFCNELTKKELGEEACVYYYIDEDVKKVYTKDDVTVGKTPYMDTSKSGYRLPTEAEWEYAARVGDDTTNARTWSGTKTNADLGTYAWFGGSNGTSSEVGRLASNAWGLHDMSGNVWEWCWDWYGDYSTESVTNPTGPTDGSSDGSRVARGGGWNSNAVSCTVSSRYCGDPSSRAYNLGFRLVRSAN